MTYSFSLKAIASLLIVLFAFVLLAGTASAHQAGSFDPADPACMGDLTSFHAKDAPGIKLSAETWPHQGIANQLGVPAADGTVPSFQMLSLAWCMSE